MNPQDRAIRAGIRQAAEVLDQAQAISSRPVAFTYVPPSHARALDLDATLIEGIRGSGKSFWFSLLATPTHLDFVRRSFPEARLPDGVRVAQGFGLGLSHSQAPDAETLAHLIDTKVRARSIWRAVVAHHAAIGGPFSRLTRWSERAQWVQENPEDFARLMELADKRLSDGRETLLILFDALDRLADDWQGIRALAKGLLQVALDMRSFQSIRCKVYARPDLLQDDSITSFPDYSKLLASKAPLTWNRADLFALLYQCLGNSTASSSHFTSWIASPGRVPGQAGGSWTLPNVLRRDEDKQEALFERIAGKAMGSSIKRGKPYKWLANHLQDGFNHVSPRSFLAALGKAANETADSFLLPLDYRAIQLGVQEASQIRVKEITEDYPWVADVMTPLRGKLTVPCAITDLTRAWDEDDTLRQLKSRLQRGKGLDKLPPQNIEQGSAGVVADLEALGIMQRIEGKRIQMPDVYRVAFGFGRRGGVKPVK